MERYKRYFEDVDYFYDLYRDSLLYKKGYSFGTVVNKIKAVLKKYERDSNNNQLESLEIFCGLRGILFEDKKYRLYRGLFLHKESNYINYYDFEKATKTKIFSANNQFSWTTNKNQAIAFAKGSTHWMDSPKLGKGYYKDVYYGVVLEYIPQDSEILIDFSFAEENKLMSFSFGEDEVVVFPKTNKFKIIQILE